MPAPTLVTDDDVTRAAIPGHLAESAAWCDTGDTQDDAGKPVGTPDSQDMTTLEGAPWLALCVAPEEGADIAELLRASGMTRPTASDERHVSPGCLVSPLARVCT